MALQRTRVIHDVDQYVVCDHGDPVEGADGPVYVDSGNPQVVFEGGDLSPEAKARCMLESFTRNEQARTALQNKKKG